MTSLCYMNNTYTVTLVRDGKPFEITFGEHTLSVHAALPEELLPFERSQIKGPVADDGKYYYIYARHLDVGAATFVWLESQKEAADLMRALQELDDAENETDGMCWCGGAHLNE